MRLFYVDYSWIFKTIAKIAIFAQTTKKSFKKICEREY